MATILNRTQTFATNGTVTAAGLHNLIDDTGIYAGLITTQTELTTVGTADQLLIAVGGVSDTGAPRRATVQNLFEDTLTAGTFVNLSLTGALTYGTAAGNRTVSTSATITTGTIPNLTAGTTTSTAATITNGTITTALIPTRTTGTTTSTAQIVTSGTTTNFNSTTGTIGNLSTTLAGDFTISQGTGTLGTTAVTAGSYGSVSAIPFITVDAKGRITNATTGTFSSTPADGSITFAKLSTSATEADNVASRTAKAWVNFNGTGTVAIRASFNVSSITDNGTGSYTINFLTNLSNALYCVNASAARNAANECAICGPSGTGTYSTAAVQIRVQADSGAAEDSPIVGVSIFN